jgi:superfamily II DNA or RNA helicase
MNENDNRKSDRVLNSKDWLPFEEARALVQSLKLKNVTDWVNYCKSGKKPTNIPAGPSRVYKNRGWKSWGFWLGTKRRRGEGWLPFEEARQLVQLLGLRSRREWRKIMRDGKLPEGVPSNPEKFYKYQGWTGLSDFLGVEKITWMSFEKSKKFVQSLGLKSEKEYHKFCKSEDKPKTLPNSPNHVYKNRGWKSWADFFGTRNLKRGLLYFEEAREIAHSLRLKNSEEWLRAKKSGRLPVGLPFSPNLVYKNQGWKGWPDFLGFTTEKAYLPFDEAREIVRSLGLKNQMEWSKYTKSGKLRSDIPLHPERVYPDKWKNLGDWLGTGYISPKFRKYLSLEEASNFVRELRLKGKSDWSEFTKSGKLPKNIPADPRGVYKNRGWEGWGAWLGTGNIAPGNIVYKNFEEAKEFVHGLRLQSVEEWYAYCNSDMKPGDIPNSPEYIYKNQGWNGMPDFLGAGKRIGGWRTFEKAREFVHSLVLKSIDGWYEYCRRKEKPDDIPNFPDGYYKQKGWVSWPDWLGYEEKPWSNRKIKELLRGLIDSKIIYGWNEAVLYSLLLRKGLLHLQSRHKEFFKNFVELTKTQEGRKAIKDYAYSDSEEPPDLSSLVRKRDSDTDEIQSATNEDLIKLGNLNPLEYGPVKDIDQILQNTSVLDSISIDEEAIHFYLNYSINEIWKSTFRSLSSENSAIQRISLAQKNGNKYHDAVLDSFLSDYQACSKMVLPSGYSFPGKPTLMQLYVAHKVMSLPYFGNFSATGTGKTLSAILASRMIGSKMTVIVCPNDVVDQWKRSIVEVFPDSKVSTGKDSFYATYLEDEYQYLVLNYDKFSQERSPNVILNLGKQKIDFIVLDEIHFSKIRDEDEISKRRRNLDGLMTLVRRKNPNIKVLGLSATPVVNNLKEGKSLLELLSGKVYDDVSTKPTIPNAVTLFEKLSTISVRELPIYSADLDTHVINVVAPAPPVLSLRHLKGNPLSIEKFLTDARIPEIIRLIDGQTIIYTEYVEDIVRKISEAVENAGFAFALYTGYDRSGLTKFLNKKVQVLIASRPLSVGVDGLQHICNRLILNTLPWTNAQYQQLLGRLVRKGQIRDVVHVYLIKASIGGYEYDELKWKRIQFKRTLADCAVDGVLPEKNLVTPQQAAMEAVKWLERLERGEISTVVRRDLNVELAPVEIKKRFVKYGDFARLNNRINNETSETTHNRMLTDVKEWDEYHRQYQEARKSWATVPYEEIIKRIKQLSPRLIIGDFGCGEAQILSEFGDNRVYSFDHVAVNNKVKACDIKSVPLPDEAIDIAVFSLSLMGRNWPEYISEAKRCLATNGYLLIADTTKSINGRLSRLREMVKNQGFEIYSDEEKGDFIFIEAREL